MNWKKDIRMQDANTIMLLDECHFKYLSSFKVSKKFALILKAYPHIAWYIKHKYPELTTWVLENEKLVENEPIPNNMDEIISDVMESIEDWVIYVTTPEDYHNLSFLGWDESELTDLVDLKGKTVVDIGSGTGKQAFAASGYAKYVYCVEPVGNLRRYLKSRAIKEGVNNLYVVDGLVESIPFNDEFADVVTAGHVIGDNVAREITEIERITKRGGMIILIPGNNDEDNDIHKELLDFGFSWSRFLEPGLDAGSGYKRKYWKIKK